MIETFKRTVKQHRMLVPGEAVLVAVSGGPDSIALLHLLMSLTAVLPLHLGIAHLNHGLRGTASDDDAAFVASAAAALNLPCFVKVENVDAYQHRYRLCREEAARSVRYRFLEQIASENGFAKVAVGHHADDNAEQVMINLMRGSGPRGLSGIPPIRPLPSAGGRSYRNADRVVLIRPLIAMTREEILAYLGERSIAYVSDDSNNDPTYLRNRVRHHLLPLLKRGYNPRIVAALNRLSAILRSEEQWTDGLAGEAFAALAKAASGGRGISLAEDGLRELHPALCRRVLRKAMAETKGNLRRVTFEHVTAVQKLLDEGRRGGRLHLPGGIHVIKDAGMLSILAAPVGPQNRDFCYPIAKPEGQALWIYIEETGDRLRFEHAGVPDLAQLHCAGQRIAFFDMNRLKFPLVVRNFRPGDRFTPLGLNGSKKVKKYFIDAGVPRDIRRRCPLLLSGGEVIWVAGHRMGASAQVDTATRQTLRAELFLA